METWQPLITALEIIAPSLAGLIMAAGFIVWTAGGIAPSAAEFGQKMVARAFVGLLICFLAIAIYETLIRCTGQSC